MKHFTLFKRFIFPLIVLVLFASLSSSIYMFNRNLNAIEDKAQDESQKLHRLLIMARSLVQDHVNSSMALLKQMSNSQGTPTVKGETQFMGRSIPKLQFGTYTITGQTYLVDHVTSIGSGTATIFVKKDDQFIRISTNVLTKEGVRAFGTQLDPNGKAIQQLKMGKPFYGVVDILDEPYISGYEPIFDQAGHLIGAWYVGYKVDVHAIDQAVKKWSFLTSGFVSITDNKNNIRFLSENTMPDQAQAVFNMSKKGWKTVHQFIPEWDFNVHIAYPKNEAYLHSLGDLYPLLLLGGFFGSVLLFVVLGGLQRFVLLPLGGDPETATKLVSQIQQGDFSEDGTTAKPDTLIDNMLKMRKRLREMVTEIKENADRLSVSSSVFKYAHDGIFITDSKANIIDVNPAFTQITGFSREESLGKNPESLGFAYQIDAFFSQFFESTQFQGEWRGEVWNKHKNGHVYVAWLDIFPVRNDAQEFEHYVGLFSDITQAKEQQKSLEHMAYHDSLTALPNRMLFSNRLQKTLAHAQRNKEVIAICYIDLDDFKIINDQHGHEIGDMLLVELSNRLRANLRMHDTLARLGGDEFALLLCGHKSTKEYTKTLDRLITSIEVPFEIANNSFHISASIGYTIFPDDNSAPDTLLRHADHAMYHAKTHGGRTHRMFDLQLAYFSQQQTQLLKDVKDAVKEHALKLYYQPQINIHSGEIAGMEALIRWQHPTRGLLQPNDFLPLIENTHEIIEMGEWVISTALMQISKWNSQGLNLHIAVNIAAHHLMQKNFVKRLAALLKQYPNSRPEQLHLEITESAAIADINLVRNTISQCKDLGTLFAIDDFGSGYSSLIYLRRLPVDTIKIDQSFVHNMLTNNEDLAVITGVITLCREFKRTVVAEGVENVQQADKLTALGCQMAQGFGIAKPMPSNKVVSWMKTHHPFKF